MIPIMSLKKHQLAVYQLVKIDHYLRKHIILPETLNFPKNLFMCRMTWTRNSNAIILSKFKTPFMIWWTKISTRLSPKISLARSYALKKGSQLSTSSIKTCKKEIFPIIQKQPIFLLLRYPHSFLGYNNNHQIYLNWPSLNLYPKSITR
jgi:hypothetical protein